MDGHHDDAQPMWQWGHRQGSYAGVIDTRNPVVSAAENP
jgi:hypothetical protein